MLTPEEKMDYQSFVLPDITSAAPGTLLLIPNLFVKHGRSASMRIYRFVFEETAPNGSLSKVLKRVGKRASEGYTRL